MVVHSLEFVFEKKIKKMQFGESFEKKIELSIKDNNKQKIY